MVIHKFPYMSLQNTLTIVVVVKVDHDVGGGKENVTFVKSSEVEYRETPRSSKDTSQFLIERCQSNQFPLSFGLCKIRINLTHHWSKFLCVESEIVGIEVLSLHGSKTWGETLLSFNEQGSISG